MAEKWDNPQTTALCQALLALKSVPEAKRFLRDLLTEQEIIEFGKRLLAAKMLARQISYIQVEKTTGLSSTTVARVSKWLNQGMNGYRLILNRLSHHHNLSSGKRLC